MIKHSNRQAGGTLLGFIVGLIVGLTIAVGVAMTIKNTPLPFGTKGKQEKASAPTADQVADPNKPLYGNKDAVKEAAREFAKSAEDEKAAAAQPADKKPDAKIIPASIDNKAPLVIDKSTPEKPAIGADDKWIYYLQAGAFRESADAENTKAKLALLGLSANISERQSDNGLLYRVRLGPFAEVETMNRARSKLADGGVDVAVVRSAK